MSCRMGGYNLMRQQLSLIEIYRDRLYTLYTDEPIDKGLVKRLQKCLDWYMMGKDDLIEKPEEGID